MTGCVVLVVNLTIFGTNSVPAFIIFVIFEHIYFCPLKFTFQPFWADTWISSCTPGLFDFCFYILSCWHCTSTITCCNPKNLNLYSFVKKYNQYVQNLFELKQSINILHLVLTDWTMKEKGINISLNFIVHFLFLHLDMSSSTLFLFLSFCCSK